MLRIHDMLLVLVVLVVHVVGGGWSDLKRYLLSCHTVWI